MITALAVAAFLRWLAVGHVTITVARTPVTVPALAFAAAAITAGALGVAAVALCSSRTACPWPADDPDRSPGQ